MQQNLKSFGERVRSLKSDFQESSASWQQQAQRRQKRLKKYQEQFGLLVSHVEAESQGFCDFFMSEFKLHFSVNESQAKACQLGCTVVRIWEEVMRLESVRYQLICESLQLLVGYSEGSRQSMGIVKVLC